MQEVKAETRKNLFMIQSSEIVVKEGFNIRQDYGDIQALADSIEQFGVKKPLSGYKENGKRVLTDGHRRFKAVQLLQSQGKCLDLAIPFFPEEKGYTDKDRTLDLLLMNDGKHLTMMEEATLFKRLKDKFSMTNTEIAKAVSKSSMHVGNALMLLDAPAELQELILKQSVSASTVIEQLKKDKDGNLVLENIQAAIETVEEGKTVTAKHIKAAKKSNPVKVEINHGHIDVELDSINIKPFQEVIEKLEPNSGVVSFTVSRTLANVIEYVQGKQNETEFVNNILNNLL